MYWKRLESKKTPRGGPTIRYLSSTSSFDASRQQRLMGAPSPSDFPIAATLPMQSSEMLSSPPQSLSLSSVRGLRHASGNSMLPVISSAVRTQPLLPPEPRFPRAALDAPPSASGCVRARSTRRTVPSGRTANELDSATIPLEWCAVWCGPLPFVVDTAETSMHRSVTRPFPIVVSSLVAGSDSRYPYPIDTATPIHLRGAKAPDQGVQRDSSYRGIHANHRNDLTTLRGKNLSIGGRQQRVLACRTATVRSVQRDRKGSIRPRVFETRVFESTVGAVADRRRSVAPDRVVVAAAAVAAATNSYVPVAIDHNPCLSQR
mmetsp:Transcript_115365/g.235865  ORF Transcript_115365/g.235865 Transcript_115365/m.235865 type:complete len:318 (-) Transcript_115365:691-1644(-)